MIKICDHYAFLHFNAGFFVFICLFWQAEQQEC